MGVLDPCWFNKSPSDNLSALSLSYSVSISPSFFDQGDSGESGEPGPQGEVGPPVSYHIFLHK